MLNEEQKTELDKLVKRNLKKDGTPRVDANGDELKRISDLRDIEALPAETADEEPAAQADEDEDFPEPAVKRSPEAKPQQTHVPGTKDLRWTETKAL